MIYNRLALIAALALAPVSMANTWRLAPAGNGFEEITVDTVDIPQGAAAGVTGNGEAQAAGADVQTCRKLLTD